MNTYAKYCPNVFVMKTENTYNKGETTTIETKYGQEHEVEVFNLVHSDKNGYHYYSIARTDGFDAQERAKRKAEKLTGYATNAESRSNDQWEKSKEGADFLALGEPIKIGHHSEKRHRALIERNHARMSNAVKEMDKAQDYQSRADYWNKKASEINLSMPESLEFYAFKLQEAEDLKKQLKNGSIPKQHAYSLTYATKRVKELKDKLKTAEKLWG
jgi:hypothetical protein